MNPLSPIKRLTMGLVFMTITMILTAQMVGLLPDEQTLQLQTRKTLTESLAIQLTQFPDHLRLAKSKSIMESLVKRNPEILSAAIRSTTGMLVIEAGRHKKHWRLRPSEPSTSKQIQVPIFSGQYIWGNMELRYTPVASSNLLGLYVNNRLLLICFIAVAGFILFGIYLRKTLKYLDPAAVIPDRVSNAMDIISEGILILDENEHIILANHSFSKKAGLSAKSLLGKEAKELKWQNTGQDTILPWSRARSTNKQISEVPMSLMTDKYGLRSFLINAAPITAEDGKVRGCMVTFNDVTQLQKRNIQLSSAVNTLKKSQSEVKKKNKALAFLASRDPLTGCLNRRAFFQLVEAQFKQTIENDEAMTCIMLDIDHFKAVNDNYGHSVGDIVIKRLAKTVLSSLRSGDLACRYGGEEFCLYLKDTSAEAAHTIAERIRSEVEKLDFSDDPATKNMKITSSFGIADHLDNAQSLTEMIELADQALYYSKENGRNRVTLWQSIKSLERKSDDKSNIEYIHQDKDTLSGRPLFIKKLEQAIDYSTQHQQGFITFLIDIDMFKRINNTLGHNMGDQLLEQINQRLSNILNHDQLGTISGKPDTRKELINLTGDEFGIIIDSVTQPGPVKQIAGVILKVLSQVYIVGDQQINLTCSIGSSVYSQDGDSPEIILRNIEIAATRAKERGGNIYQPYLDELNTTSMDDLEIENKLHNALRNHELYLHYQPKVDLRTGRITGMEALARWRNPELGEISPGRFIPIAESAGIISELGLWVLKTACQQGKKWLESGLTDLRVAVNLSALQLKKHDFLDRVMAIFDETGFDPHNLEFEVTENMVMENIETVTPILYQLHEKGVAISIDDFGIGYSSLNYIKRFPISVIKIDRSFIVNISEDKDDHAIVSAIIAMAHALNLKVVAEGAEHSIQVDILRKLKCDQLQGFIFSKPLSFVNASKLLAMNLNHAPNSKPVDNQDKQANSPTPPTRQ